MTIWLYKERGLIQRDGPFYELEAAMLSPLWKWPLVCLWIEEQTSYGWYYENLRWDADMWRPTSHGVRPAELIRPQFLLDAKQYQPPCP